jgi:hypothetical protein
LRWNRKKSTSRSSRSCRSATRGRVITVVELLSPSNKAAGSSGRQKYVTKQNEVLAGPTHLLEIDLLRQGQHTVVAPRESLVRRMPFDYLVSLSRGGAEGPM